MYWAAYQLAREGSGLLIPSNVEPRDTGGSPTQVAAVYEKAT